MLNVAVIGLGWWGQMHLRSTHGKSDKVAIVAISDIDANLAASTSAELEIPIVESYDAALADPAIEAVILVTPHSLHTDQIVAGAAAGKHIFTEKPFALNRADAEHAVAAAEDAGIRLGLGHNQRYAAAQTRIKEMIDAGELGEIMHMEGNLSHDTLADVKSWRHSADEAPGGGLWHMGSHYIDLFQHFAGPIAEVYAQAVDRVIERDSAQALLTFESGATGYVGNVMVTAQTRMLNVLGSKGWVKATGPNTILVGMRGAEPQPMELDPVDPVRANVEGFADAIAGRAAYRFTHEDMIRDVAALDAVAQSLKSGRRERVA